MSSRGQTINDRLNAAKYTIAGQSVARCICKATTEEMKPPKKKHLDFLVACTHKIDMSMMELANMLIERTNHSNWVVVYKALISVHHLMSYGSERFTQYLASSNYTFQPNGFHDKVITKGYNMSTYIRRYAVYINQKSLTYRSLAIDLCRQQRTKDKLLMTMPIDRLLETLPTVHKQLDSLMNFDCTEDDLNNGIIVACFKLLFYDAIRLFANYNDGIINLFEKYFDLNKKMCREAFDSYKRFLNCADRISEFLRVAKAIHLERGDVPNFRKAPSSLLEALEQHLISLESNKRSDKSIVISSISNATIPSFSANLKFEPCLADSIDISNANNLQATLGSYEDPTIEVAVEALSIIDSDKPQNDTDLVKKSYNDQVKEIKDIIMDMNNMSNTNESGMQNRKLDRPSSVTHIVLPPPSKAKQTRVTSQESLTLGHKLTHNCLSSHVNNQTINDDDNNNNIGAIQFDRGNLQPNDQIRPSNLEQQQQQPNMPISQIYSQYPYVVPSKGTMTIDSRNNLMMVNKEVNPNAIGPQQQPGLSGGVVGNSFDAKPPGYSDGSLLTPEFTIQTRFDPSIDLQTQQQLIQIQREQAALRRKQIQQQQDSLLNHGSPTSSSNGANSGESNTPCGLPMMNHNNNINNYTNNKSGQFGRNQFDDKTTRLKTKHESIFEDLELSMRKSLQQTEKQQ